MSISISTRRITAGRVAMLSMAVAGVTGSAAFAASDVWSVAPADSNWTNAANWTGGNVPGDTASTTNTDTATFGATSNGAVTIDANRNLQNFTFNGGGGGTAITAYTLSGGPLNLTSGGLFQAFNSATNNVTLSAPSTIQGDAATYTFDSSLPGTSRLMTLSGTIAGTSSGTNVTGLTLTGTSGAANLTSGVISDGTVGGKLSLTKNGTGLWVINAGINTYTGGTTINAGTLRLSGSGNTSASIGTGALTLNGGTLRMQSTTATTVNNALVLGVNGGTISARTNDGFAPTSITGTGPLNLGADAGTVLTPTSFYTYAGTVNVISGSLRLGTSLTNYDAASLGNAVLNLSVTGTAVTRGFGTNGAQTVNIGTLAGVAGTFIGGNSAGTGVFTYSVGGRNEDSTFAGNLIVSNTTNALTKVGSGALTLSGANTYTGVTNVSGGSLVVNGTHTGAGNYTVAAAGTLAGTGTVTLAANTNTVTVNGAIAPGSTAAPIETLDFGTGNLTLAGTANYQIDQTANANDKSTVGNALTYGGVLNVAVNSNGAAGTYDLFDFASQTGAFSSVNFSGLANGQTGTFDPTTGVVSLTAGTVAVPEPTTLAAVAGLGALLIRRRRQA